MSSRGRRYSNKKRVVAIQQKRPIDKQLLNYAGAWAVTQTNTTLYTATFPATITGLRWELNITNASTTTVYGAKWAIVRVKDGLSPSTIGTNGTLYSPESEVMAAGTIQLAPARSELYNGDTKTMRKLQNGDKLYLCTIADSTNITANTLIQFFVKS